MVTCPHCKKNLLGVFEFKIGVAGTANHSHIVSLACSQCRGLLGFMPDVDELKTSLIGEVKSLMRPR